MNSKDFLKEGFVEDAHIMHQDHEVQMAREECYHAAENAIALHKLLRNISEQQGLDGWVSAKITLAGDYLKTVREYIEYELMTAASQQPMLPIAEGAEQHQLDELSPNTLSNYVNKAVDDVADRSHSTGVQKGARVATQAFAGGSKEPRRFEKDPKIANRKVGISRAIGKLEEEDMPEGMMDNPGAEDSAVAQAIIRRILLQRTDLLAKHGPEKVGAAVDEVADFVGDVDEIGSSDVSGWVRQVEEMLGNMQQGVAEGSNDQVKKVFKKNGKPVGEVGIDPEASPGNGQWYMKCYSYNIDNSGYDSYEEAVEELKYCLKQGVAEGSSCNMTMEGKRCPTHGLKKCPGYKSNIEETTAGSVAGVVNPTPKNKAKVGTLFGGTYKQKKSK